MSDAVLSDSLTGVRSGSLVFGGGGFVRACVCDPSSTLCRVRRVAKGKSANIPIARQWVLLVAPCGWFPFVELAAN